MEALRRVGAPALSLTPYTFHLDQFEGPLEVLLALVQRREVDVYRVQLLEILRQYTVARAERPRIEVDISADMLALSATLLLIKSRALLQQGTEEESIDPFWIPSTELLEHLVHYCHLKSATERLVELERQQALHYLRPSQIETPEGTAEPTPLLALDADELRGLFAQLMAKTPPERSKIHDEPIRLSDVLRSLMEALHTEGTQSLLMLFQLTPSRGGRIVLFLAILELMRRGSAQVRQDPSQPTDPYWLTATEHATQSSQRPRRGRTPATAGQTNP